MAIDHRFFEVSHVVWRYSEVLHAVSIGDLGVKCKNCGFEWDTFNCLESYELLNEYVHIICPDCGLEYAIKNEQFNEMKNQQPAA